MSIRSVVPDLSDVRNHLTKLSDPTDVIVKHDGSAIVKHAINRKSTVFYSIYSILQYLQCSNKMSFCQVLLDKIG